MDFRYWAIWLVKAMTGWIASWTFPRFLLAAGVPLDDFAAWSGAFVGTHISTEAVMWGLTTLLFIALLILTRNWGAKHISPVAAQAETPPHGTATISQDPELMSLQKAATSIYGEMRDALKGESKNASWDNPKKALGLCAHVLVGNNLIPILGVFPPSELVEKLPKKDATEFGFTGDASELFDQFDRDRRWKNLQITVQDFEKRMSELKVEYGNQPKH